MLIKASGNDAILCVLIML